MAIKSSVLLSHTIKTLEKFGCDNLIFSPQFLREGRVLCDNLRPSHIIVIKNATKQLLPIKTGDMPDTYADISDMIEQFHHEPITKVSDGIKLFVAWCHDYYKLI
jgi:UDP-glucose 6-dehydrogenase